MIVRRFLNITNITFILLSITDSVVSFRSNSIGRQVISHLNSGHGSGLTSALFTSLTSLSRENSLEEWGVVGEQHLRQGCQ